MNDRQTEVHEQLDKELTEVHTWTTTFVMLFMIIAATLYILPASAMVAVRIVLCVGLVLTALGSATMFLRYIKLLHS